MRTTNISNAKERIANTRLLANAIKLEDKLIGNYNELIERASLNNVREVLVSLIEREEKDKEAMEYILKMGGSVKHLIREDKAKDLEMFDHQLSEDVGTAQTVDTNSVTDVVRYSLREINELASVFDLVREEYDNGTEKLFTAVYNRKLETKKKLETFLESLYSQNR